MHILVTLSFSSITDQKKKLKEWEDEEERECRGVFRIGRMGGDEAVPIESVVVVITIGWDQSQRNGSNRQEFIVLVPSFQDLYPSCYHVKYRRTISGMLLPPHSTNRNDETSAKAAGVYART